MAGAAVFRAGGIPALYTNDNYNDNDGVLAPAKLFSPYICFPGLLFLCGYVD